MVAAACLACASSIASPSGTLPANCIIRPSSRIKPTITVAQAIAQIGSRDAGVSRNSSSITNPSKA